MKTTLTAAALALLTLAGCANRPESIPASFVSWEKYSSTQCAELEDKLKQSRDILDGYSRQQNDKANGDALGVFLLGIPFSKLTGDFQADIAKYKGEIEAIETAKVKAGCK